MTDIGRSRSIIARTPVELPPVTAAMSMSLTPARRTAGSVQAAHHGADRGVERAGGLGVAEPEHVDGGERAALLNGQGGNGTQEFANEERLGRGGGGWRHDRGLFGREGDGLGSPVVAA